MNTVTTLYTPGTGLPDFEMRVALGLCAAALNIIEPEKVKLQEEFDRYAIVIVNESNALSNIQKSLGWLCQNKLADQSLLLRTPGFRPLHLDKQAKGVADFGKKLLEGNIALAAVFCDKSRYRAGAHDYACTHTDSIDEKIFGALLAFSPHLGQPPKRNNVTHQITLPVCPCCGVAGLAGTALFQIDISISNPDRTKKERIFFLPRFKGETNGVVLSKYLAATKHVRGNLEDIPSFAATLALLALYPHLIDSIGNSIDTFFVGRLDSSGNAPRYGYNVEQPVKTEIRFLDSLYNRAFVQRCYSMDSKSELLGLLARSLQNHDEKSALDFARCYVSATESKAMLPQSTAEFFAKEVCKMDKSLLEGEEFKVIKEVADMLQYFVRERNFGYVDNLRKARDADEFAKLLLDAQREAQSTMLDPKKQNNKPFLPGQDTIQHLLQIINQDEKLFKSAQTLIALLAFTYYKREA
jgi:hypothetical protein